METSKTFVSCSSTHERPLHIVSYFYAREETDAKDLSIFGIISEHVNLNVWVRGALQCG